MATEIWIIIVSVSISIIFVSLLGFILNRRYRKRRSLAEIEKVFESNNDQRSKPPITEAPSSLSSSKKHLEADHDSSINEAPPSISRPETDLGADYDFSIKEAPPPLSSLKKDLEADYNCPPNTPVNEAPVSLYSPEKALQDLIDYQRYYLKRRPDHGESAAFTTSRWGTTINYVPSKFHSLPGAQPFFSFESAHPLERNGVRTEALKSPRKNLPRAPRREIGSENEFGEVEKISVDVRVRKEGGNGILRRTSREVDLRGRRLEQFKEQRATIKV